MRYLSNARENQDLVALCLTRGKHHGTYLEVGAFHPVLWSNTYLLESQFGWRGIGIECELRYVAAHHILRRNPCVRADATAVDYDELLERHNLGPHLDFLQLDIEPAAQTLMALKRIDLERYSFSFVTFEHDRYAEGDGPRNESREILRASGYTRIISDVMHGNDQFEDWYVHPDHVPQDVWGKFASDEGSVSMDTAHMSSYYRELIETTLERF